ncbi:MAG: M20/M25/M40 family metallo-hydrolase [Planctomycetota bacterium]
MSDDVRKSLTPAIEAAIAAAEAAWPQTLERLKELVHIPSCSFSGFDPVHVVASANNTADWLRASGFPDVEVLPGGGPHPAVIASDRRAGASAPTLLLYAHHDVQPPLREELWTSPPFEPTERGGRLYARGAADDKAGIMVHCASAAAWRASHGKLPINLVAVIEGEEEIGSPNFSAFLRTHRDRLRADALVIADAANYAAGMPSLTTSLRGNVVVEVELSALKSPLHSGLWGGAVPDVTAALARMLGALTNADGSIALPELLTDVRPMTAAERADLARLPYTPKWFADVTGLLDPTLAPADSVTAHTAIWRRPALTISAMQAGQRGKTGNVIMDSAWARVSVRIVPDQDPLRVQAALVAHFEQRCPQGMRVRCDARDPGSAWATDTDHPIFAAARAALHRGYGVAPVAIGCGASIPFVGEMSKLLGGVPALLTAVEDPICGAHAENESLLLADALSALRSEVALFGLV